MSRKPRIYYTETDKALMWDHSVIDRKYLLPTPMYGLLLPGHLG
jgi:hypothetical protein